MTSAGYGEAKAEMNGIVFFDYDGTLTDGTRGINEATETTREAVAALRANGYLAVLDTGRAMCYAGGSGVAFDGYITSNGAHASVLGETILDRPIDEKVLSRFMERLDGMGISCGIDHPEKCYASDPGNADFIRWIRTFGISPAIFRPVPPDGHVTGYKLSVLYHTMEEVDILRAEFGDRLSFDCINGYPCVDVSARGMNKGIGVRAVIERFGLKKDAVYALGDGQNDMDMLAAVGHPIAMGKHAPSLEGICEFITKDVPGEGIDHALRHYGLI